MILGLGSGDRAMRGTVIVTEVVMTAGGPVGRGIFVREGAAGAPPVTMEWRSEHPHLPRIGRYVGDWRTDTDDHGVLRIVGWVGAVKSLPRLSPGGQKVRGTRP
ncbi:MAG: hypothetical protein NZM07_09770 [Elioraea sp.]|nr:hypothetical protein [Elioraea sp.]